MSTSTKFLFNTTFTVDDQVRDAWLRWMADLYVPSMRAAASDCPHELYAIDGSRQDGAQSYSSQWRCSTLEQLGNLRGVSARLCQDVAETMGERCLGFSTLMRRLNVVE